MGWIFRRSRSFGSVRVTLSKRGIGWSVGNRFFRWGVRADGRVARSFGIPGTGLRRQTVGRPSTGSIARAPARGTTPGALLGCLGAIGLVASALLGLLFLLAAANTPDPAAAWVSRIIAAAFLGIVVWRLTVRARRSRAQLPPPIGETAFAPPASDTVLARLEQAAPAPPAQSAASGQPIGQKCPNPACPATFLVTQEHIYEGSIQCAACGAVVALGGTFDPATEWERDRRRMAREREARRVTLAMRFGNAIAEAILDRKPFVGATQEIIEEMFGKPENIAREPLKKGPRVTWRYGEIGISGRYSTRIRFTNGLCDSWKVGDI